MKTRRSTDLHSASSSWSARVEKTLGEIDCEPTFLEIDDRNECLHKRNLAYLIVVGHDYKTSLRAVLYTLDSSDSPSRTTNLESQELIGPKLTVVEHAALGRIDMQLEAAELFGQFDGGNACETHDQPVRTWACLANYESAIPLVVRAKARGRREPVRVVRIDANVDLSAHAVCTRNDTHGHPRHWRGTVR